MRPAHARTRRSAATAAPFMSTRCLRPQVDLASFLMHRVDAARQLMHAPGRGAEATGRLFLAKRCHEAVKAGQDLATRLPGIVAEVAGDLQEAARPGVEAEAEAIRRQIED